MNSSSIHFEIALDENSVPEKITWQASDRENNESKDCKALMISLWDRTEKNTMRIDLWTKCMPIFSKLW